MIRACQSCGKKNRIPPARLADKSKCGSCKALMGPTDTPIDVNGEEFREIIKAVSVPVLVDFWAEWCGPCRMAAPEVARVAENLRGKALVLRVDTQRSPDLAESFQVRGIPNFAVLKDGRLVRQQAGLVNHREMERWLTEAGAN